MSVKKKIFWVTAFIVFMAVAIVLCMELFGAGREMEFDGTLVNREGGVWTLLTGLLII
ncbi:hypothetical protein HNQ56_003691 [Anaerotaenia torta]|uniref:hypothetical protein n=1 Tax=Anaerotaenia torta TaxID=433293 RepID=UPI003D1DBBE9